MGVGSCQGTRLDGGSVGDPPLCLCGLPSLDSRPGIHDADARLEHFDWIQIELLDLRSDREQRGDSEEGVVQRGLVEPRLAAIPPQ